MTVATQSGYTWTDGKNARVLHDGNRLQVKTITASAEAAGWPGIAADKGNTVDRWRPFANLVQSAEDLSEAEWTIGLSASIGSDGQTFDEGTGGGFNKDARQDFNFAVTEYVFAVIVERQTMTELRLQIEDSASVFTTFAVADFTTETASTGKLIKLGPNEFVIVGTATPTAAGVGTIRITAIENGSANFTGTNRTLKIKRVIFHESFANLRYDLFSAQAGDCIGISAHNLGAAGARIRFEHDSDNNDAWTEIGAVNPIDNSPIMFFFDAVTSSRWRIRIDGGALPEVGVFRVGSPLKIERPFYGGFAVPRMARQTKINGNLSGSGELLGESVERTTLQSQYQWQNLSYAWVRANLDGKYGMIQSIEGKPFFLAWRPSETQDVDYVMRGSPTPPQAQGTRDLWSFGVSGEAWAYD